MNVLRALGLFLVENRCKLLESPHPLLTKLENSYGDKILPVQDLDRHLLSWENVDSMDTIFYNKEYTAPAPTPVSLSIIIQFTPIAKT